MSRGALIGMAAALLCLLPVRAAGARGLDALRLVATETTSGVTVRVVGAATIEAWGSTGLHVTLVQPLTVRVARVRLARGPSVLRLFVRDPSSRRTATLGLVGRAVATAAPSPSGLGAAPPSPPAAYVVPADAVPVSTPAQLQEELAKPGPHDIVLADGSYSSPTAFHDRNGDHLYAAHLGRAVLHAGITLAGNYGSPGGSVQGLSFDVSDPAAVDDNAIVDVWGAMGADASVQDTTLDGHGVVGYGIDVSNPEGFVARRVVARNFTSDGISVDSYPDKVTFAQAPSLSDIDVANVARPTPRSSNGTSEACVWLGTQVTLSRAKLRNCAWAGLWTGFDSVGALYSDVDVDGTPVGVYLEHFTSGSTFRNVHVGPGVRTGFVAEWADPAWSSRPASVDNVIENSLIESSHVGVYLDQGTTHTTVRDTTFRGQAGAAIVDYLGVDNAYSGNDYAGILPGAVAVSTSHL